jgi:hypothetical protein
MSESIAMKTVVLSLVGAAAMFGAACACTAATFTTPIEASRYRTADGVEVITGRPSALPSTTSSTSTPATAKAATTASVSAPPSKARDASDTAMLRPVSLPAVKPSPVPPDEQASRDRERVNILTSELIHEGQALEKKRTALRSPKVDAELSRDQQQTLREEIARHEANVKALNAELRRAGSQTRVGAANP